jgi:adenine-specific DNA-methyltransferase
LREDEVRARGFAKRMRRTMPGAEVLLWSRLRRWPGAKFRRQHPIGPYIADFASVAARLVIEVDGETHGSEGGRAHDHVRDDYMRQRGWRLLRVWNRDVYGRLDDVLEMIARLLPPPPRARARSAPPP